MLKKLKADSSNRAILNGMIGVMMLQVADNFAGWVHFAFLTGAAFFAFSALNALCKTHISQAAGLQEELAYRRQHSKWRWEF
jgi:hypothetical protein